MRYTNNGGIALPLAVWLVHDEYDYIDAENYISATALMKPLRHILIPPRIPAEKRRIPDVEELISRAFGHALHDSIEKAWVKSYVTNMRKLGYTDKTIERVLINPTDDELEAKKHAVPVYLEQRGFRKIVVNGRAFIIGGKFDMSAEGIVHDNKSTTAYTWLYGGRDEDYKLQGSLYRWIEADGFTDVECTKPIRNPRITEDFIRINFIFTDWQKATAKQNPNYPQRRLMDKDIPLMSLEETEAWVIAKLKNIIKHQDVPETQLPECTDEELWRTAPQYKYYSDPAKIGGRSTKNFDDPVEARKFAAEKGKGVVVAVPGEVKRCEYCPAFDGCSQKDRYFPS